MIVLLPIGIDHSDDAFFRRHRACCYQRRQCGIIPVVRQNFGPACVGMQAASMPDGWLPERMVAGTDGCSRRGEGPAPAL